jgi:Zn-dependent peptidase ImmA (M78 family)
VSAEKDAQRLLEETWGAPDKIRIPVDPVRIAHALGVKVRVATVEDHLSGALVKKAGRDAVILLNASDSQNRQRFTCAHELGHYYDRVNQGTIEFEFVDRRDQLASKGVDRDEIYANQFAAELLMPEESLRKQFGQARGIPDIAYRFGVSPEAMAYRLKTLGLRGLS